MSSQTQLTIGPATRVRCGARHTPRRCLQPLPLARAPRGCAAHACPPAATV